MGRYIIRRALQMIPVLFLVSLVVFFIVRIKGDPVLMLVPDWYTEDQIAEVRQAYGFDQPIYIQYIQFASKALQGDFGRSFRNRQPAWDMVMHALPRTAQLAFVALFFGLVISLPLGILSAIKRNSPLDLVVTSLSIGGRALPSFWLGIMLILLFSVTLKWLPVSGTGAVRGESDLKYIILPAFALSAGLITTMTRLIRSSMLEVMQQEYVTTARAKGLRERTVLIRHVLRNALIPVVTVLGLNIAWLLGGAVIIEQVFAWPGMGRLMIQAIYARDNSVVQAGLVVSAVIIMIANLSVDIVYSYLDPRIRYS
ncbi:MAG: ABC transporter permease [Chloroflexi bacterium]|nr:ABC transporter permease [Chloroflexota bacterium]